jgi:MtfA peptidase
VCIALVPATRSTNWLLRLAIEIKVNGSTYIAIPESEVSMVAVIIIVVLLATATVWVAGKPFYVSLRRRVVRKRPFPEAWRKMLRDRVPLFRRLPTDLQLQLKQHIQVFIDEKLFVGCNGVVVNDEIRVTIAAQACLLLLNRPTDYYPSLTQVLVYPAAFIVNKKETDAAGVLHEHRQILSGESWTQGQVILSWQDTVEGAAESSDGRNVVIHEFAHQLDMETGPANGAPQLAADHRYERWSAVLGNEFARLQQQSLMQVPSLFDQYGATNPAEFFAVASEVFFEQPNQLNQESPALYNELKQFYCVDPTHW